MAQKYNEKPHKIKAVKGTTDICPSKAKRMVKINGLEELDYGNSLRKDSRFDALKSNKQPQKNGMSWFQINKNLIDLELTRRIQNNLSNYIPII